jgi:hypothetical protein
MSKRGRGILRGPGLCAILGIGRSEASLRSAGRRWGCLETSSLSL